MLGESEKKKRVDHRPRKSAKNRAAARLGRKRGQQERKGRREERGGPSHLEFEMEKKKGCAADSGAGERGCSPSRQREQGTVQKEKRRPPRQGESFFFKKNGIPPRKGEKGRVDEKKGKGHALRKKNLGESMGYNHVHVGGGTHRES